MKGDYYNTKPTVEAYIKSAKDINGGKLIERLKLHLPKGSTILEIGSGPGSDWEILDKAYNAIGSDNSTVFLEHLIAKNPQGEFLELDATSLKIETKVDGIYSNKVLQHLTDNDLANSIKRQQVVLNPGGIISHSFWKGEGSEIFKGLFVNYHSEQTLRSFFEEIFEILHLESYAEFEPNDSIQLIARKKENLI